MQSYQRKLLIVFGGLLVLTGAGLVVTTDWGSRTVSRARRRPAGTQSPVDMQQMQTAMTLAPLAASAEEQDRARDALQTADHEVDYEFAAALDRAASQTVPSTPEIRAIQQRISKAESLSAEIDPEVARLTKLLAAASENQKPGVAQQLDLAKARQELNEDELADAHQDLERAGGDPHSQIQRMVDDHNSAQQDRNGQLDLSMVGTQAGSTLPASNSFLARARALYALHSFVGRLGQAEQMATARAATFSSRHDEIEHSLEQAKSQQTGKQAGTTTGNASAGTPASATTPDSNSAGAAISSYRSLVAMQKRMSSLDSRIRNEQDLAGIYGQWITLATTRERGQLHSLLVSFVWILVIVLTVLIVDRYLQRLFNSLEPDQRKLLTMRAVADIATRGTGAILILLVIFGLPNQMATILALAGAGLTVALKDFIVGFFGWFVLMGKNGIRHGDWVEINGVSGEVVEIGLFHTVLLETGNWNDSGHPTGRRVTFVNSYAIEGHYFNFSTSGQWLWDEVQFTIPVDRDPYPIVDEIQKIVVKETEANARLAEQEWDKMKTTRGTSDFAAGPAISVRPASAGFEILIRYVTRASERHQQRSKLYFEIVALLRQKNIPEPVEAPPAAAPATAAT
jgi:small-conductance mechanosensitive channel